MNQQEFLASFQANPPLLKERIHDLEQEYFPLAHKFIYGEPLSANQLARLFEIKEQLDLLFPYAAIYPERKTRYPTYRTKRGLK